jgi:hypothetical protein
MGRNVRPGETRRIQQAPSADQEECTMAQVSLNFEFPAASIDTLDLAYEIGRDHACHGLRPPAELLLAHPSLRRGWEAGRASFAARSRAATPQVRQWLTLRLQAWQEGRHFELLNVTPHYLGQISAASCPVSRVALGGQTGDSDALASVSSASSASSATGADNSATPPAAAVPTRHRASIVRVCEDAAYAAGNLVSLSTAAATAKAGLSWNEALLNATACRGQASRTGLSAAAWGRLGVLMSFVTPLDHDRAARIPLLVLPPNRLRLLNPVQGLQAFATLQLARSGWSQRLPAFEALLPSGGTRREFKRFFMRLLTQALANGRPDEPLAWRWALEDAWRDAQVQQLWAAFALQLGPRCCERLLDAAAGLGLAGQRLVVQSVEQATEGWSLATHGYSADLASPAAASASAAPPDHAPLDRTLDRPTLQALSAGTAPQQQCLPLMA